jgi:hypothetical protein
MNAARWNMTLAQALTQPLRAILRARSQGLVAEDVWRAYAHAWMTGAPRFGAVRYCNCAECLARFPASDGFRAPFASELWGDR